jgi:hypothetical protein
MSDTLGDGWDGTSEMNLKLLRAIQHYCARAAIGSSSMRGAGSVGVVLAARTFLGAMPLRPFGSSKRSEFKSRLDEATESLKRALPKKAQKWGLARKGLNIFMRNCLYTSYLREEYQLGRAEAFFEIPLDSITGTRLVKQAEGLLPAWKTVRGLTTETSAEYQAIAAKLAASAGVARVHLDAMWWGEREGAA